jgi:TolB-like protein
MRAFIDELRQRNVFRVATAYIVAGWLIAQVADLLAGAFRWPDAFLQMIIVVLFLGFPIALIFAWAFELTPGGVRRASELPAGKQKDPRSGRLLNRLTIAGLTIAVIWLGWDRLQKPDEVAPVVDKSIAVLPFADFSPDGGYGWFADGLTEEILNALARTTDLRVASRTSSFQYRGSDTELPAIAAEIGVAHVLEGSVRRSGDRLRVTAQLIRAADDTHLWSDTFDGSANDSIDIQERIARQIANALQTATDPDELAKMLSAGTTSVEAWELFLRGNAGQRGDRSTPSETLALYTQAVAVDPTFADAYMAIANLWMMHLNPTFGFRFNEPISDDEARDRLHRAIESAAANARSALARHRYEAFRAQFDVRLLDYVAALRAIVDARPERFEDRARLLSALIMIGDHAGAREAGLEALALAADSGRGADLMPYLHLVDADAALKLANLLLAQPNIPRITLYQAHRALLYSGKTEEAARVAALYGRRERTPDFVAMVEIRQACAEGRTDDADRIYEDLLASKAAADGPASHWLLLQTLGRTADAADLIRGLDEGVGLFALSTYLTYTHFDPSPFPNLTRVLEAQGINRPPPVDAPFFCRR